MRLSATWRLSARPLNTFLKTEDAAPDIAWKRIAGMRDKMIHEYFGVNLQLVWDVVRQELPGLRREVEDILSSTEGREAEKGSDRL